MSASLRLDDTSMMEAWQTPHESALTIENDAMNINKTTTHPPRAETTKLHIFMENLI